MRGCSRAFLYRSLNMKNYQLKVILKNSKPPLWRRCMVPSGITFAQLGIILETILEWVPIDAYEFEFFQAGIQLREWRGEELTLTSYNYDYMCSSDTYIDSLFDREKWFTFRVYDDGEFRVEIEKCIPASQEVSYPLIIKQKGDPEILAWSDPERLNKDMEKRLAVHYGEPDYRSFCEITEELEKGIRGLRGAVNPIDRTERNEKSTSSKLEDFSDLFLKAYSEKMTANILDQLVDEETGEIKDREKVAELIAEAGMQMHQEIRSQLFGTTGEDEESRGGSVKGMLLGWTKEELKQEARALNLTRIGSLSKERLAELIKNEILKPEMMENRMMFLSDEEIEAFEHAIEKGCCYLPDYKEQHLLGSLFDLLYVAVYRDDYVEVPTEVIRAYKEINTPKFQKKRRSLLWMYRCLKMVEAFYAVAPVSIVCRMLQNCLGYDVSRETFIMIFRQMPYEKNPCVLRGDRVVCKGTLRDNLYLQIEERQGDKEYYIPGPEEITDYYENGYPSKDPVYQELLSFLVDDLELDLEDAWDLMPVLWGHISLCAAPSDIMDVFEEEGIAMPSEEVFSEFIMLLMDVNNHTRMVSNRGFTPLEMAERMPHAPKGTRSMIVPMSSMAADLLRESQEELSRMGIHADPDANAVEIPAAVMPNGAKGKIVSGSRKIYPNDPCPCGSGKKYKKCCGKNK